MMEQEQDKVNNIANAHKNFLKWAVYYLYLYGREKQAEYWWKVMHDRYPQATPPGQDLSEYALERAKETVGETAHDDATALIGGFVETAYSYLLVDETTPAETYLRLAEQFRNRFQDAIGPKSTNRVSLPEMKDIQQEVLDRLMSRNPTVAAILRTKLGLSAAPELTNAPAAVPAPATNGPPAAERQAAK
jgi:hypothetical protein